MIARLRVALVVLAFLALGRLARADEPEAHRLAFVGAQPALDRSAGIALSSWHVEVVPVDEPVPSGEATAGSRAADTIAKAHGVDAVAWLVDAGDARTLLLYDARTGQLVSRQVAGGPMDDAAAASIALSLKTLLRASTVAPVEERIGAPAPPEEHGPGQFRLEADATLRVRGSDGAHVDPRVGLAFAW